MTERIVAASTRTASEPGALVSFLADFRSATLADVLAWEAAAADIHTGPLAPAS